MFEHRMRGVKGIRRLVVGAAGTVVLLVGIAMIVLPGPAVVVIPAGLGILASEFLWARNLLNRVKAALKKKGKEKVDDAD